MKLDNHFGGVLDVTYSFGPGQHQAEFDLDPYKGTFKVTESFDTSKGDDWEEFERLYREGYNPRIDTAKGTITYDSAKSESVQTALVVDEQACYHEFKRYEGLSEAYDYCTKCDYKDRT